MDCPRCGAQTTSPHECYVERELHGRSWTFNPPPAYEPPQYSEPLGPPLTVMTNRAGWQLTHSQRWVGQWFGCELVVFAGSSHWKWEVRRDGKRVAFDISDYSTVEQTKWTAMLAAMEFTKTLGERECSGIVSN